MRPTRLGARSPSIKCEPWRRYAISRARPSCLWLSPWPSPAPRWLVPYRRFAHRPTAPRTWRGRLCSCPPLASPGYLLRHRPFDPQLCPRRPTPCRLLKHQHAPVGLRLSRHLYRRRRSRGRHRSVLFLDVHKMTLRLLTAQTMRDVKPPGLYVGALSTAAAAYTRAAR